VRGGFRCVGHPRKAANFGMSRALGRMTQIKSEDHPTILVTDDDNALRPYAAQLLEQSGYTVVEADSADEALKVMEARKDIRLLFTDIQMPGKCDGLELAREVHKRWPDVLLIITSARVKPPRAEIADDGRFIRKPYRAKDLLGLVGDVLKEDDEVALQKI
jgi:CheY-like chemotaxis protein